MPRPKGSKNHASRIQLASLPSIPPVQSSAICNLNDDFSWMKTMMNNKGSRPKNTEVSLEEDNNWIPTSSPSDINGNHRVVVNPAVLRYLEQNRNTNYSCQTSKTNGFLEKNLPINPQEDKDDSLFDNLLKDFSIETDSLARAPNEPTELDRFSHDDLCWDVSACSTDYLTSVRLAEWILTHQEIAKLETNLIVTNLSG
ncbi:unnamed protein product [Adineta ricciae]|uniref:Uncharacterized protein n=1 Tax=Adineta ricciae TaxID=249248 RepID=A0A813TMH5_ADIRI|nr:unnamed protein product [Adineta ricciae]CAF0844738.1 unnamed protein product [Adineta ricciae]